MRGPLHVTPETTVFSGVQQMVDRNIGCLLVLDENKALAGIITERDYLRKIAVLGRRSSETTVAEIMTPGQELVIVTPDCQLRECADILNEVRAAARRGGGGWQQCGAWWCLLRGERFSDDPTGGMS
jgi:CBS domain-containing protein